MLNLAILNNLNLIKLCIQKFTNQFEENKSDQNKKRSCFRKPGFVQGKMIGQPIESF